MRYLFLDLEFASSMRTIKICEFGYVITDENFEIIEEGNILINPRISRSEWIKDGAYKRVLTRKIEEYESKQDFKYWYWTINKVIRSCDYIFGYAVSNDIKALNCDCQRYKLPSWNIKFIDVINVYNYAEKSIQHMSLSSALESMDIEGDNQLHDAQADAYNTMNLFAALCGDYSKTLTDYIKEIPNLVDQSNNFCIKSSEQRKINTAKFLLRALSGEWDDKKVFVNAGTWLWIYADNYQPEKIGNKFTGKNIAISDKYERNNYKNTLNLIRLIKNEGGQYSQRCADVNTYITCDDNIETPRDKYVLTELVKTKQIELIKIDDLMKILGVTNDELSNMPFPSFEWIFNKDVNIKKPRLVDTVRYIKKIKNKFNLESNDYNGIARAMDKELELIFGKETQ